MITLIGNDYITEDLVPISVIFFEDSIKNKKSITLPNKKTKLIKKILVGDSYKCVYENNVITLSKEVFKRIENDTLYINFIDYKSYHPKTMLFSPTDTILSISELTIIEEDCKFILENPKYNIELIVFHERQHFLILEKIKNYIFFRTNKKPSIKYAETKENTLTVLIRPYFVCQ